MGRFNPPAVYLVGAGPGEPGLITVRGARLLERADVVIYDHLASKKLLSYCPRNAQTIYVGKVAGAHSMTQDQINDLLVEQARAGKRVVRLKGGDPFVFGRGGEECEALARAKVPFEVVPGITAAIASAAYAGIPVTHRDFNSSFTLVTGHERGDDPNDLRSHGRKSAGDTPTSDIDWSVLARLPCVAFYMGVKSLDRICANLIAHGMSPDTPAATIQWGTTPRQRTVAASLRDLPRRVAEANIGAPAVTVIGRVVALRETINWFESRPLFGKTIVVTRTRQQASELALRLEELGAGVIEAPTIEVDEPADWTDVDVAIERAGGFDWVVFTSANGVRAARRRLRELHRDARTFGNARIAAVGDATARAIEDELNLHVDLCPERFVAEALADELSSRGQAEGKRFLLLQADIARTILRDRLRDGGAAEVREVAIYQTRPAKALPDELLESLDAGQVDWVTFTSGSTATNFAALLGRDRVTRLEKVRLASIGPITSDAMRAAGLEPTVEAEVHTIDGLVDAILRGGSVV